MSMVLRTNMNSMNANRNLSINNSQVAKSIEKLASGFAINRAADDASGLAISEKMQAQITGLDQGTENALDGIGLVQTAEGAMEEIHNMLNRIVELSTKSANGTIQDEVDREAIQAEVDVLIDEIDRIAQATNFNGIDLLNGNLSDGGLVIKTNTFTETITTENTPEVDTDTDVDTDDTIGNTGGASRVLNIDTSISTTVGSFTVYGGVQGTDFDYDTTTGELTILSSTDMRIEGNNSTTTECIVVNSNDGFANLALKDVDIINDSGSAFSTGDNDVYIELEGSNELSSTFFNSNYYGSAGLNVGENGSIIIDGIGTLISNATYGAAGIGSDSHGVAGDITINGGTIIAQGGNSGAGIGSGNSGTVGDIIINGGTVTATGSDGGAGIGSGYNSETSGNIVINNGVIISNGGSASSGIGSGAGSTIGDIIINGGNITATGGNYGAGIGTGNTNSTVSITGIISISDGIIIATGGSQSAGIGSGSYSYTEGIIITGGDITATGGRDGAGIGTGANATVGDITYVEECVSATAGISYGGVQPENIGAGTNGTVGTITTIPLPTTDPDVEEDDTDCETTYTTTTVTRTETEVYNGDGLILHVADQNQSYNKIQVYIDPMTGEALKIKPLYVDTQEFAGAAINIVKDAINYVSMNRANVGALQNRLERTINNNNNTSENMTTARSAIKDCDMAKEMMEYTKMDVLTQASQSMLAQSNQAPQQVLSLLG